VLRRTPIFRLVFLLLQLSPSLEASSFQNLSKTQKWHGLSFWSLLPGSNDGKTRFGLSLAPWLDGWRAEKKNESLRQTIFGGSFSTAPDPQYGCRMFLEQVASGPISQLKRQKPLESTRYPILLKWRSLIGKFSVRRRDRDFS
jgi:hypothetical protein